MQQVVKQLMSRANKAQKSIYNDPTVTYSDPTIFFIIIYFVLIGYSNSELGRIVRELQCVWCERGISATDVRVDALSHVVVEWVTGAGRGGRGWAAVGGVEQWR